MPVAPDVSDWRLQGQERYLQGKAWKRQPYQPYREGWDHDHCEMCATKLALEGMPDAIHDGWSTDDGYHWVCPPCFEDFRASFAWSVADV